MVFGSVSGCSRLDKLPDIGVAFNFPIVLNDAVLDLVVQVLLLVPVATLVVEPVLRHHLVLAAHVVGHHRLALGVGDVHLHSVLLLQQL